MIQTMRISRRHLPDVLHLMVALREDLGREVDPRKLAEEFHTLMGRREGGLHVFVAREGRFPIGYLAGCFGVSTQPMVPVFCIHEIFVAKPYRGGRVFRALGAEAVAHATAKGARLMELRLRYTQRDLALLAESLGFEPTGRQVFERIIDA
ncbi:MAG: GNAT family N-acetyltransferase [Candidatus Eisenbacteria bacterium]|jgi:GNAT superfamily N-acetyltransferase|nr:GNAT family N-acetyltransferase [Candidatus Eisenbacteria bacterium]